MLNRYFHLPKAAGAAACICMLLFARAVCADEVSRMTLSQCIDAALQQSVVIHAAREGVNAAEAGKKESLTNFLPTLSTSYTYTRLNEAPEAPMVDMAGGAPVVRPAPIGTEDNYVWRIEATQPVFAGGKIYHTYKMREIEAGAAREEEAKAVQDTVMMTTEAYFELLKTERLLDVAKQALQQMEAHYTTAQSFYDVGLIPKNDLLSAELELAGGQHDLLRAEHAVQIARTNLNVIMRRDVELPVIVEDILQYESFDRDFAQCAAAGYEHRPELKYHALRLDQAKRYVDIARGDFYPSLSVVGNYSRYGDTPGVTGSAFRDQEDWSVMGVAQWDFWQWGRTKFAVDAGRSRENQASDALAGMKDRITLEIKRSYLFMREAEKQIAVAEKAIESAEENYRINVERFKEQVARSTDVIDAQTFLTKTKSDYYNALSDYNIARARLERAMGTNVRTSSVSPNVE